MVEFLLVPSLLKTIQRIAPNRAPTPAVNAIAIAPQKVTRPIEGHTGDPPARAARKPSSARISRELPDTVRTRADTGSRKTSRSGRAATTTKDPAEASAACIGRALIVSVMPSSSRARATQGAPGHQLSGYLTGQFGIESPLLIDGGQFCVFGISVPVQMTTLPIQFGTHPPYPPGN